MESLLTWIRHAPPDRRPDDALLAAFLADHDERAFAEVVRRHGPVVWGACRRLLPDPEDAEDAFQAAFLVLVRRGYRTTAPLGPWLHRVGVLTARGVRRRNARRLARTGTLPADVAGPPAPDPIDVDGLLLRLPEKYRAAVVLCCLEGLSEREAADRVGCPVGTLSARLSRGLARLRARAGGDPRVLLAVTGAVPASTAAAAVRTAVVVRVASSAGAVPAPVSSLAEGVVRMLRLGTAARLAAVALVAAVGFGLVALAADPSQNPAAKPPAARSGAQEAVPTQPAVVPIGDRAGADVVGPPEAAEADWKAGFRAAYQLPPGQAVGFVKGDPFPAARWEYLKASGRPVKADAPRVSLSSFVTDGARLVFWGGHGDYGWEPVRDPRTGAFERKLRGRPLWLVLQGVGLKPTPVFDGDPDLLGTELHGDAVFREGATVSDLARDLPGALKATFGVKAAAVARLEERPVATVRGKLAATRKGELMIDVSASPLAGAPVQELFTHQTFFRHDLFAYLTAAVGGPVVDETDADSWDRKMEGYRYVRRGRDDGRPRDLSADREAVLKHFAAQTGLTVSVEKRRVWVLSVKKPAE
jgi:DNA-directed RNA polymerase specialized sigma24 family protein